MRYYSTLSFSAGVIGLVGAIAAGLVEVAAGFLEAIIYSTLVTFLRFAVRFNKGVGELLLELEEVLARFYINFYNYLLLSFITKLRALGGGITTATIILGVRISV